MLTQVLFRLYRLTLPALLAVAVAGTGFAHRSPVPDAALAFALATGAGPDDVCGDSAPGDRHAGAPCLACQITGSAALIPAAGAPVRLALAHDADPFARRDSPVGQSPLDPAHGPQGPPVA